MTPTPVYDAYWRFAAERQAMYLRRLKGEPAPWTEDPILQAYRFTNPYRAADRVSQFLIERVQYREGLSARPSEVFFRTLLFKLFNKIETWELIQRHFGDVNWQSVDLNEVDVLLEKAISSGRRIYSAAYIMPAPRLGRGRKHSNHLQLLKAMMEDALPARIERATSLASVYDLFRTYPGLGTFLAFQYTIDLNYADFMQFNEDDFVVAGPGALDGIAKCFGDTGERTAEDVIHDMVERQDREFARLGLNFAGLFGRKLKPVDCQNLFCEISKYARVAHPTVKGLSDRTRIKQGFKTNREPLPRPFFPPKWGLSVPTFPRQQRRESQPSLF
jgi:hypothetical protein